MVKLVNRAKMSTATTGTGTITLGSAEAGYQSFAAAGVVDGDVIRYVIEDGDAWEIGTGTYTASGTTLTRTVSESSNADAALNLTGAAVVFVSATEADIVQPGDNVSDLTNDAGYTTNTGTVISVDLTAGTGISVSGGPITASGAITVTNTAPDQTVVLTQGANVTITGTYPTFTIAATDTNTTYSAGTGIDLTGTTFSIDSTVTTLTGTQTLTNKTLDAVVLNDGYTEEVFAVTGTTPALSPTNGSIQTWTLSGNSTPTAGTWAAGQSITLLVDDGTANTITWTTLAVVWKTDGGVAPTLNTSGDTVITLWKVGTTIYGARVGDA